MVLGGTASYQADPRKRGDGQQRDNEFRAWQAAAEQRREAGLRSEQQSHHQSEPGE